MPLRETRCSVSFGESLPSQSRPWLVNQSSFVFGWKSMPTELRTPRATVSRTPVFGSTRLTDASLYVVMTTVPGARHALGPHLDLEARGYLELVDRQVLRGFARHFDRERVQRRFGHRGRLALLPGRRRRGGGLVLRLGAGECGENSGSESGSHRSSPRVCAAIRTEGLPGFQRSC